MKKNILLYIRSISKEKIEFINKLYCFTCPWDQLTETWAFYILEYFMDFCNLVNYRFLLCVISMLFQNLN